MRPLLLVLCAWLVLSPAFARAQEAHRPTQVITMVVIQAGLGAQTAEAVRTQLAQRFSVRVVTLQELSATDTLPDVLLTLALDARGTLSAMYWNRSGTLDVFSAPAPDKPEAVQVAATTLASTVLQKHIAGLRAAKQSATSAAANERDPREAAAEVQALDPSVVYAALARLSPIRPRTLGLKLEDF
jgi:hypothetical protein